MDGVASTAQLVDKAQQLLAAGNEDLAIKFLKRAQEGAPQDAAVVKLLGEALMDVAKLDEARAAFQRSAELDPKDGGVWMYLGQIAAGKEALGFYEKGVTLLMAEVAAAKAAEDEAELASLADQLACAYCSLAELFMSDLCFEADAESRCEQALKLALEACPDHPQALQGMASFRLSQCKPDEAKPLILRCLSVVEGLMSSQEEKFAEAMAAEETAEAEAADGDAAMEDGDAPDLEDLVPPFEFRAAMCRILLEVEEFARAVAMLERLVEENDEIAEVWLLLGQGQIALGKLDLALECMERATELCDNLIEFDPSLSEDEQFVTMMNKAATFKKQIEEKQAASEGAAPATNGGAAVAGAGAGAAEQPPAAP